MDVNRIFKLGCFLLIEVFRLLVRHPSCFKPTVIIRFLPAWLASLQEGRNPLSDKFPWIAFAATDFLESVLNRDMKVFEYGSGGSTLFFADRVCDVVSVEHDRDWYDCVERKISEMAFLNCHLTLVEPVPDKQTYGKSPADPHAYCSDDANYRDMSFKNYVSHIDYYPDGYFDVVIIDGRARPSCCLHAVEKIKSGGFLILDNAERSYYSFIHDLMNNQHWIKYDFYGLLPYQCHFSETCIWRKIS